MFNVCAVTDNVNIALQNAGTKALQMSNYQISTEYLLYGILSIADSTATKILNSYGVSLNSLDKILNKNSDKKKITVINNQISLTQSVKEIFLIAEQFANQTHCNIVSLEHVLVALLLSDEYAVVLLKKNFKVSINELKGSVLQVLKAESINKTEFISNYNNNYTSNRVVSTELPDELLNFGIDLTKKARDGKIGPIIGRDDEIARVVEILCRKTKNNPVLIGEAGVGKSAVIDGLAKRIAEGTVPSLLRDKIIFSLELGGLLAGTKYRGDLEEKLKNLINIITSSDNIIVFIDEIHTLAQAGSDKGEINPADMLKPYLARGEFQTIGATTTDEYKKYIEIDKALERRFQPVFVNPPSVEDTIKILYGLKESFEKYHNVKILDEAIIASVTLSDKYVMDRNLPDKAIDIIDEASSKAKVYGNKKPKSISTIDDEIKKLENEKINALNENDYETAGVLRDKISELIEAKNQTYGTYNNTNVTDKIEITEEIVSEVISEWTKIPISKLTDNEKEKLLNLEQTLHNRVIGQDEAVEAVSKAIKRAKMGLRDSNRPIGSFMFLGPTGVGKTELSKALAEAMFNDEKNLITLDMSEYMEKHNVSRLIGSPPGYVGYDEGGQLTEQVRRKPYSVVLFDEIEKAHPDVFNLLLQVLEEGRLTDTQGRVVSFKNTVIIFTSNVGMNNVPTEMMCMENVCDSYENIKAILLLELKKTYKPEFLNRIDTVTVFKPFDYEQLAIITKIFISKLNERLKSQGVSLKVTENTLEYLVNKGYNVEYGARPIRRLIEQEIEDKIAEDMLIGKIPKGSVIIVFVDNNEIKITLSD